MPVDAEVGVEGGFAETAFVGVDGLQVGGVGDVDCIGADADDGAVEGVEGVDPSAFVADVGVVGQIEGGEAREEWAGDV